MLDILENDLLVHIDIQDGKKTIDLGKWFDDRVNHIQNNNAYTLDEARYYFKDEILGNYGLDVDDKTTRTLENKGQLCSGEGLFITKELS